MSGSSAVKVGLLARKVRMIAADVSHVDRAKIIREVLFQVRQAVKHDCLAAPAPQGREWELERLNEIYAAAEKYWLMPLDASSQETRNA